MSVLGAAGACPARAVVVAAAAGAEVRHGSSRLAIVKSASTARGSGAADA